MESGHNILINNHHKSGHNMFTHNFHKGMEPWSDKPPKFGAEMRKEFLLDENVTFLNHCGKGAVPRRVYEAQINLLMEFEQNPELFWKATRIEGWHENIGLLARFLGADMNNLAFVENATRGISNILKSYPFVEGDAILYNTKTHPAIKNQIEDVMQSNKNLKLEILELQLRLPARSEDILEEYSLTLKRKPNIKLAVIDYVNGSPATLFPIKKLIRLCHQYKTHVLVDGAHAPGLIPIKLEQLGADFFVGNLHKWLFCPRGCAIQYVAPKHHRYIRPCVMSFDAKEPYPKPFVDQGTRNEIPYLCVEQAIRFYEWVGGYSSLCAYNVPLIQSATKMLTSAWGTSVAEYPDDELVPFIRNIRLPKTKAYPINMESRQRFRYDLYYRFHIWAGVFIHNDSLWVRISAQIYCTFEDYEKLRDAVLVMKDEEPDDDVQLQSKKNFAVATFVGP